ncbi:hypothetical protein DFH07DRAFT_754198 [Mycena maculata]|uniref:RRM domain-containing protein n=1 Tax=Mycena maculata TaxID=230809 RepID=A0AAD7MW78_9AGAR|nr:hypothetical protein DFH07DRAFT_754198 [Mycena maculata]
MDVDMKTKEDGPLESEKGIGAPVSRSDKDMDRERERDRERDRDRDRDSRRGDKDRDRDRRDSGRPRRGRGGAGDHWEPDSRNGERRKRSRSRSRSRSRRRSASPRRRSRRSRSRSRSRSPRSRSRSRSRGGKSSDAFARSLGGPMNADHEEAVEFSKVSKRENRVYVGNLSYEVRYRDLMEFMRGAGEVLFAEVLVTPTGVSKGCGIVEFASQEDSKRAVRELSEVPLLGRPVFIREDRETEARFGATPVPGKIGMAMAGQGFNAAPPPRPASHNHFGTHSNPGNQLYVGNARSAILPYQAGWQDLKDLFRVAGNIVRADINLGADGRPKGSGTVVFETAKDAAAAISMYHGTDWYGRTLEVREDRYAGLSGAGGFRGGLRGARGLGRGLRGGGFRGGFRGGAGGYGGPAGRDFSNQDLYADYSGPDQAGAAASSAYGGGFGAHGHGGAASFATGPGGPGYVEPEPSQQIMVRNLPWSTANEDLVELFETTGQVEVAEILFDGARSKGSGVVQFAQVGEAETAIAKFQQYMYGGRPLDVRFNDRWHTFTPTAAKGGQIALGQADMV